MNLFNEDLNDSMRRPIGYRPFSLNVVETDESDSESDSESDREERVLNTRYRHFIQYRPSSLIVDTDESDDTDESESEEESEERVLNNTPIGYHSGMRPIGYRPKYMSTISTSTFGPLKKKEEQEGHLKTKLMRELGVINRECEYAETLADKKYEEAIKKAHLIRERTVEKANNRQERKTLSLRRNFNKELELLKRNYKREVKSHRQETEIVYIKQVFDSGNIECSLCCENPKDVIFSKCGHFEYCRSCAERTVTVNKKCPLCSCEMKLSYILDASTVVPI